jgi:hypothetical protein
VFHKLILALSLMLLLLLAQQQAAPAKEYSAERFDVSIAVQEGGSLIITEAVTFKFVGGPFTFVFRDIPTDKTDGISISSASMNGQTIQQGTGAGQIEIAYGNPVKVTWHFAPVSDQTLSFVLTYKVLVCLSEGIGFRCFQLGGISYKLRLCDSFLHHQRQLS